MLNMLFFFFLFVMNKNIKSIQLSGKLSLPFKMSDGAHAPQDVLNLYNSNKLDQSEEQLQWKHPFTCIIAGPSGSGKTQFVLNLLRNADVMFTKKPQIIDWYYGETNGCRFE